MKSIFSVFVIFHVHVPVYSAEKTHFLFQVYRANGTSAVLLLSLQIKGTSFIYCEWHHGSYILGSFYSHHVEKAAKLHKWTKSPKPDKKIVIYIFQQNLLTTTNPQIDFVSSSFRYGDVGCTKGSTFMRITFSNHTHLHFVNVDTFLFWNVGFLS